MFPSGVQGWRRATFLDDSSGLVAKAQNKHISILLVLQQIKYSQMRGLPCSHVSCMYQSRKPMTSGDFFLWWFPYMICQHMSSFILTNSTVLSTWTQSGVSVGKPLQNTPYQTYWTCAYLRVKAVKRSVCSLLPKLAHFWSLSLSCFACRISVGM